MQKNTEDDNLDEDYLFLQHCYNKLTSLTIQEMLVLSHLVMEASHLNQEISITKRLIPATRSTIGSTCRETTVCCLLNPDPPSADHWLACPQPTLPPPLSKL
jgi:hypothetical protein